MKQKFGAQSTADEVLGGIDLTGKRVLVTGISSGIGRETGRALASRGANIVGTGTDLAKAEVSTGAVRDAALQAGGSLELIELDLGSLQSIHACADTLLTHEGEFDVIIANAGVMATPFARTSDGFELQFGINYLGHFALLRRIEPLLADGGRLVVLSSQAHRIADIDLSDPHFEKHPYDPWVAYGRSKTASSLFAVEFDRRFRERGIRAASVMPGNSGATDLTRHLSPEEVQGLLDYVGKARADAGLRPAELKDLPQAAATSVWAAFVADAEVIGGHYLEDCSVAPIDNTLNPFADGVKSYALDVDRARLLWAASEELVNAVSTRKVDRADA